MEAQVEGFESGILLFVIIATSLVMTWAMIRDKRKMGTMLDEIDQEILERNLAEDALRDSEMELSNDQRIEKAQQTSREDPI